MTCSCGAGGQRPFCNNTLGEATEWEAPVVRMGWPGSRIHDLRVTPPSGQIPATGDDAAVS